MPASRLVLTGNGADAQIHYHVSRPSKERLVKLHQFKGAISATKVTVPQDVNIASPKVVPMLTYDSPKGAFLEIDTNIAPV